MVGTGPEPLPVPEDVVDDIMDWSAGSGVIVYRDGRPVLGGSMVDLETREGGGRWNGC